MMKRFLVGLVALTLLAVPAIGGGFRLGLNSPAGAPAFNITQYFNTTVYTGNGAARSIVTGIDLANNPGMVMVGQNEAFNPFVFDTARGAANFLRPGDSSAEGNSTTTLSSFNNNGFSYGTASGNQSGIANAAWSIRKHPKLFNVITYTGDSTNRLIPHGLSTAPGLVILKMRSSAQSGIIWHKGLTAGNYTGWDSSTQFADGPTNVIFGGSSGPIAPDAANVYVGASGGLNTSGNTYVMYVYADDPTGYIASGTYIGNGSTAGPVVSLGWEPQWILVKGRSNTQPWVVADNVRTFASGTKAWAATAYNTANTSASTSTSFQPTTTSADMNTSGVTYLYTAIRKP